MTIRPSSSHPPSSPPTQGVRNPAQRRDGSGGSASPVDRSRSTATGQRVADGYAQGQDNVQDTSSRRRALAAMPTNTGLQQLSSTLHTGTHISVPISGRTDTVHVEGGEEQGRRLTFSNVVSEATQPGRSSGDHIADDYSGAGPSSSLIEPGASSLARSSSSDSLSSDKSNISFFGDRPGVMSIPNTLSTGTQSGPSARHRGAFPFLLKTTAEKGFNLVAIVPHQSSVDVAWAQRKIEDAGFQAESGKSDSVIFGRANSAAKVTLNKSDKSYLLNWSEDVLFLGKNSAHTRSDVYRQNVASWALERRMEDWSALGLREPQEHSEHVGFGNRLTDFPAIPSSIKSFSQTSEDNSAKEFFQKKSLSAAIDGGNFLSNGAPRGQRIYIVGLDSVAFTFSYMGEGSTPDDAILAIKNELHLSDNDKVIFVEQPTFHIDMCMTFIGENEVVLSDTQELHALLNPDKDPADNDKIFNKVILEEEVHDQLERKGINVERKPWAGDNDQFNLFNGEFVKSVDSGQEYFITNGVFGLPDDVATSITEDITEFYDAIGIEVIMSDSETAQALLSGGGGIGCKANALNS